MPQHYDVIFKGELAPGFEAPQVIASIASLFKVSENKAAMLLNGKAHTLKKDIPEAVAQKYQAALAKAGALVELHALSKPEAPVKMELSLVPLDSDKDSEQASSSEQISNNQNISAQTSQVTQAAPSLSKVQPPPTSSKQFVCPKCRHQQQPGNFCISCGVVFEKLRQAGEIQQVTINNPQQSPVEEIEGNSLQAIVAIMVATLIGAFIWKAIALAFEVEIGLVAWGIGGLIGFAAVWSKIQNTNIGIFCGVMAIVAIIGGKYWTVEDFKQQLSAINDQEFSIELQEAYRIEQSAALEYGQKVLDDSSKRAFMVEHGYSDAYSPKAVTREEIELFDQFDAPRLQQLSAQPISFEQWQQQSFDFDTEQWSTFDILKESFGVIDLLFLFLGVGTAFRMGRGE